MPIVVGPVFNEPGTPATPLWVQCVLKAHTVEANGTTKKSFNVWYLRRTSPNGPPIVIGNVNNMVAALMTGPLSAALSVAYVTDALETKFVDNPFFLPFILAPTAIVGAIAGDRMPSGNGAVTIRLKTNSGGRNFLGSKHFSPIAESDTTLDNLNAGAQARWDAVAALFGGTFGAGGAIDADGNTWNLAVVSQELSDFTLNPSLFTYAYVVSATANAQVGTMKRRKQKP